MSHKPSENEVRRANADLVAACNSVFNSAIAAGLNVQPPPTIKGKPSEWDILGFSSSLAAYFDQTSAMLTSSQTGATAATSSAAQSGNADMGVMLARLRERCAVLVQTLQAAGATVPSPPTEGRGVLADWVATTNYHAELLWRARNLPQAKTATPAQAGNAGQGANASLPVQAVQAPSSERLTAADLRLLNWTEKVQYVQGRLSVEQARAAIAARTHSKLTAGEIASLTDLERKWLLAGEFSPAQARAAIAARRTIEERSTKPTLQDRLLAAKGVKTVAEARQLAAFNPNPNLD